MVFPAHFADCAERIECRCETKRYSIVFLITIVTFVCESVGGYWTGSLALLSDSAHVLTDSLSVLSALAIERIVRKDNQPKERIRGYGGLFNACLMGLFVVLLFNGALERLKTPTEISTLPMFFVAILGFLGNFTGVILLESSEDHHLTNRSLFLHVLGDTILSAAVILTSIIIHLTGFFVLDAFVSFLICFVISSWTIRLFKQSARIFYPH